MKRLSGILLIMAFAFSLTACTKAPSSAEKTETAKEPETTAQAAAQSEEAAQAGQKEEEAYNVEIRIRDYGTIRVELDPQAA